MAVAAGVNVRRVNSTHLLELDRQRKESNATWDNVAWEEAPLISGEGSEDCLTEISFENEYPAWRELLELQRKHPETCDVHIFCCGGYIACHRGILQQSQFLKKLIIDNLKSHTPCCNNVVGITLDADVDVMKYVVSLMYTGSVLMTNTNDEQDVKDVLRLFQIELRQIEKISCQNFKQENIKRKKIKTVHAARYSDIVPVPYLALHSATTSQASKTPAAAQSVKLGSSSGAGSSTIGAGSSSIGTGSSSTGAGPSCTRTEPSSIDAGRSSTGAGPSSSGAQPSSTGAVPSSSGVQPSSTGAVPSSSGAQPTSSMQASMPSSSSSCALPEICKVPPGNLTSKKPTERIQRHIDDRKSSTSGASKPADSDDESDDESAIVPLPEIHKVAPGALVQLHMQPRIVRNACRGGRRGRGGRKKAACKKTCTSNEVPIDPETEDSDHPKGKYEQDSEYVPPGAGEEIHQVDEVDPEENVEIQSSIESVEEIRRPQTRMRATRSLLNDDGNRYPKRLRRKVNPVSMACRGKQTQETPQDSDSELGHTENVLDSPRSKRTRGKGISPSQAKSSVLEEVPINDCYACEEVFMQLADLKFHLENTNCGKNYTGMYDLEPKYCKTCKSFFKTYSTGDFMEHVNMCVLKFKPRWRHNSAVGGSKSTESTPSTSKAVGVRAPLTSPVPPPSVEQELTSCKDKIEVMHAERSDILGLIDVGPWVTKLTMKQVQALQETVRRGEKTSFYRSTCPPGFRYVFRDRPNGEDGTSITAAPSVPTPTTTAAALPAPPKQQPPSAANNTIPSASNLSAFEPYFTSTPLFPKPKSTVAVNNAKRTAVITKPRPGPLSSKKRARPEEVSKQAGNKSQEEQGMKKLRSHTTAQKENNEPPPSGIVQDIITEHVAPSTSTAGTEKRTMHSKVIDTTAFKLRTSLKEKLHHSESSNKSNGVAPKKATTAAGEVCETLKNGKDKSSTAKEGSTGVQIVPVTTKQPPEAEHTTDTTRGEELPNAVAERQKESQKVVASKTLTTGADVLNNLVTQFVQQTGGSTTNATLQFGSGTIIAPEQFQPRYSPISSASSRTSTPEKNLVPFSSQPTQPTRAEVMSTVSLYNPLQMKSAMRAPPRPSPPPPPMLSQTAASIPAASNQSQQSSTRVPVTPMSHVPMEQARFPGQHLQTQQQGRLISQSQPPQLPSVPSAVSFRFSQQLMSQGTMRPVMTTRVQSATPVSQFQQIRTQPVTQLPTTNITNVPIQSGLEVRRVDSVQQVQASISAHGQTVTPPINQIRNHPMQQQQQGHVPPSSMDSLHMQQHCAPVHTNPVATYSQQPTTSNINSVVHTSRMVAGRPSTPIQQTTFPQQFINQSNVAPQMVSQYQNMGPRQLLRFNPQQAQYQRSTSHSIQSLQPPSVTAVSLGTQYQTAPPAIPQQYHPSQQALGPTTVQQQLSAVPFNSYASSTQSSVSNASNMSAMDTTAYVSSQYINNHNHDGNVGIATVRLPVSLQMNPLASNRRNPVMTQQSQQPMLHVPSNSVQLPTTSTNSSNNFVSHAEDESLDEPRTFECADCGDIFGSEQSYADHKNDGLC